MKITLKRLWLVPLVAATCMKPSLGLSEPGATTAYLVDSNNSIVRSGSGLCWRTGSWTTDDATAECDPDLAPRPEPAKPAAAPTPAPPRPMSPPPAGVAPSPPKAAAQKMTLTADALFDAGKATLRPEGKTQLDQLASRLNGMRLEAVLVVGHADRVESQTDSLARKLSMTRAEAVKDYLASRGVEPQRMYVEGQGRQQPATGSTCKGLGTERPMNKKLVQCLQPDRRVEIEAVGVRTDMNLGQCMGQCDQAATRCRTAAESGLQKCLDTPGARAVVCGSSRSDAMFECEQGQIRCKSQCGQGHY